MPKIDHIIEKANYMTDKEFHYKFVDLYMSLRDSHNVYAMPGPHKCIIVQKAIRFEIISDGINESIVAAGFDNQKMSDYSPEAKRIEVGDKLVSIDGIDIREYLKLHNATVRGIDEPILSRTAIRSLSIINGAIHKLPENAAESYEFEDSNEMIYRVELPWISITNHDCITETNLAWNSRKRKADLSIDAPSSLLANSVSVKKYRGIVDRFSNTRFYGTIYSNIEWSVYTRRNLKMGIIKISNFAVKLTSIPDIIEMLRNLIFKQLRNTDSILIDVRSNSGGLGQLANLIPQLFGSKVVTGSFRALVGKISKEIFSNFKVEKWSEAYGNANANDKFTPHIKFTEDEDANSQGQAYSRPVGVFTNGDCYSACEAFTANMKDNNIATIFGEDYSTGGGDTSTLLYNEFLSHAFPQYFYPIPYAERFPSASQDFQVSFFQFVRLDGTLIEDIGIKSDNLIRPSIMDLSPINGVSSQYDRIADILYQKGIDNGLSATEIKVYPETLVSARRKSMISFSIFAYGYSNLSIFDENSTLLETKSLVLKTPVYTSFYVQIKSPETTSTKFKVCGYGLDGKLKFSTWRFVALEDSLPAAKLNILD